MSLADNKRNVFTTIGSYTSLMEESKKPLQTDLFPSVNNEKDIVPFLLDVMKTIAGTVALKETIGSMFTKLIGEVEPSLKTVLKKQFIQSNSDNYFSQSFCSQGINILVKDIDINGKLKVDPNSEEGGLLYNTKEQNFDRAAYNAISNVGTSVVYNNMTLKYNDTTDKLQITPTTNMKIGTYFENYIDNAELIDKKAITSQVMDSFYGTLSKKQNKSVSQNQKELEVGLLLKQVLNDNDSFEISPKDYDAILEKASELSSGLVTYDLGCGLIDAELDFNDLDSMIKSISGSTDPFFVSDQFEGTIEKSSTTDATEENKQTIKDGFFQKIINITTIKLLEAVTTAPQIRVLLAIMSSLENNGTVLISDPKEDMKKFKTCIQCMAKEIMRLVAAFIFALAVAYLIKLLKPVITRVLKEKINQFIGIIKSLTGANKFI